ncbi:methyltransferase domain-containing protein [bacterium]|nr:methyltransferase domain-containing protein [bacterium]
MNCRHCQSPLHLSLVDLGSSPPSNAYLTEPALHRPEAWFPLRVLLCQHCWLAQTEDFADADQLFCADYSYFSSFSVTWLNHCQRYVNDMIGRFSLHSQSLVVEVAANDGYLLQFVQRAQIPCLGIEPTAGTAAAARAKGLNIVEDFFSARLAEDLARRGQQADLMVAKNVLAHVPHINDFVAGFRLLLKEHGVATFEFPHLLKLLQECQFDTIYHEHFSYLSLAAVGQILESNGLRVFDVEQVPTHGGSLRVFAQLTQTGTHPSTASVAEVMNEEAEAGLLSAAGYADFQARTDRIKNNFVHFLIEANNDGKSVAAYGAAAKGNTLLNYAGIRSDLLAFVVDRNPSKQGKFMPGSRIPIVAEEHLQQRKPDYVVILPWNLKEEVVAQLSYVRSWGGKFVTAIPELSLV